MFEALGYHTTAPTVHLLALLGLLSPSGGAGVVRRDYLFVQPFLRPPGGGEGVASWMLQTLMDRGSVTLLCGDRPDFAAIDAYYGTSLSGRQLEVRCPPDWLLRVCRPIPHKLLRLSLLMAMAKRWRGGFRHTLSAFNELDLGGHGVQYIHYPCQDFRDIQPTSQTLLYRCIWSPYLALCRWLSSWSAEGVRTNFTLANSAWTGSRYQDVYGRSVDLVLYPPALGSSGHAEEPRQERFLSIGRVISDKRWLSLVAIIERVRAKGHEVGLTLAGASCTPSLLERLERLQRVHPWLTLVLDQPREEMDRLIATHRYGLHGMHHEHYGMAVAELVLGGCLTLVHDSGGQVEIVTNPEARYSDDEDAVVKIDRMLRDPEVQARLERSQRERAPLLTRERFVSELRGVLDRLEAGVGTQRAA